MARSPQNSSPIQSAEARAADRVRDALGPAAGHVDDAARARVRAAALERAAADASPRRAFARRPLAYSLIGATAIVAVALGALFATETARPSMTAAVVVKRAIAVMERVKLDPNDIIHDVVVEETVRWDNASESTEPLKDTARYESWRTAGGGTERVVGHSTRYDGFESTRTVILSDNRRTTITEEGGSVQLDSGESDGSMTASHYRFAGPCAFCHDIHSSTGGDTPQADQAKDWDDGGQLYRWLLAREKLTLSDERVVHGRQAYVLRAEGSEDAGDDGAPATMEYVFDIYVDAKTFQLLGYDYESSNVDGDGETNSGERRSLRIESSEVLSRDDLPDDLFSHDAGPVAEGAVRTGALEPGNVADFDLHPAYWLGENPPVEALMPGVRTLAGAEAEAVLDAVIYSVSSTGTMSPTDRVEAFYSVVTGEPSPSGDAVNPTSTREVLRLLNVVTFRPAVHQTNLAGLLDQEPEKTYRLVTRQMDGHRVTLLYRLREGLSAETQPTPVPDDAYEFAAKAYVEVPGAVVQFWDPSPSFAREGTSDTGSAPTESLTEAEIERLVPLLVRAN